MKTEIVRKLVNAGKFFITDHALFEAFKDGITSEEIIFTLKENAVSFLQLYHQRFISIW